MTVVKFQIPEEESPEPGCPDQIEHGCDYILLPEGKLEFYYNFLVYTWHVNGEEITARAYLDEPGEVSVFVPGSRLLHEAALQPLVRYLQRRFRTIKNFHADDARDGGTGYVLQFERG